MHERIINEICETKTNSVQCRYLSLKKGSRFLMLISVSGFGFEFRISVGLSMCNRRGRCGDEMTQNGRERSFVETADHEGEGGARARAGGEAMAALEEGGDDAAPAPPVAPTASSHTEDDAAPPAEPVPTSKSDAAAMDVDAPAEARAPLDAAAIVDACELRADLRPGDVLFIPEGWWHYVVTPVTSVSVSIWF